MKKLFLLLLISTPTFAQEYFEILCKGTYAFWYTAPDTAKVIFLGSRIAAGNNGTELTPGYCAWADRPYGETEPRVITLNFSRSSNASENFVRELFMKVAFDPNCVIRAKVKNENDSLWLSKDNYQVGVKCYVPGLK